MAIAWTRKQEQVITSRNRNLLVSAAAGSGKTAVLVERIVRMITEGENPLDIDRLLVMTFTNAAAAEMRERVAAAIEKRLEEHPDDEHLQMQATLVQQAQITTIDSFCLNVIRSHFDSLDIDPSFRIGDEGELMLLRGEVMDRLLEDSYRDGGKEFTDFVETYASGKGDYGISDVIQQVYTFSQSHPWPKQWFDSCRAELDGRKEDAAGGADGNGNTGREAPAWESSPWMKFLLEDIRRQLEELRWQLEEAVEVCGEEDGPEVYLPVMEANLELVRELCRAEDYRSLKKLLLAADFGRLKAVRGKDVSQEKKKYASELRDRAKKAVQKIRASYFEQPEEELTAALEQAAPAVREVLRLAEEFSGRYQEAKREKNIVDFNDLEHFALQALSENGEPSEAAKTLSQRFEEILVDEYQDSNEVQETLIRLISRERLGTPNVFMVGDVKQSIYRFRLAKPELFLEKYNSYPEEEGPYQKIELHQNFRSRASVLESVNQVFFRIMTSPMGGIPYTEETALHPGAVFEEIPAGMTGEHPGKTELLLLDVREELLREIDQEHADYTAREMEARLVAARIRQMTDPDRGLIVWDKEKGEYRRARFGDMVILLRSMSGWAEVFVNVLMNEGIPAHADSKTGYFDTLEVETVLALLSVLDNPMQDIPLAAVMKSPIGDLSDQELAKMASYHKKTARKGQDGGLYGAWRLYLEEEPGKDQVLRAKLQEFDDLVKTLREESRYLNVRDLIYEIFRRTGYYDYVTAMPGGDVRRANLDMLVEKAAAYEKTSYRGLFHFVSYIRNLKKYNTDFGEASIAGEHDDTVRVMSIHKSKGLEFPVVFLAGLGKSFNKQDTRAKILMDSDLGIGTDSVDLDLRTKVSTIKKNVLKRKMDLDAMGEELRILYVAMSRAKEKLVMTAADKSLEKKLEKWSAVPSRGRELPFTVLSTAGSYLDWILMSLSGERGEAIQIRQVPAGELVGREMARQAQRGSAKEQLLHFDGTKVYSPEYEKEIRRSFSFRYPFQADVGLHTKMTVSELKQQGQMTDEAESMFIPTRPAFMSRDEEEKRGAFRGTAYHRTLELLDFARMDSLEAVEKELNRLVAEERLTGEYRELIRPGILWDFFRSPLGTEMREAAGKGTLHKEQQFVIGVPARELDQGDSDELVLIQGIIDAYMDDGDGLILIDYKTDYLERGQEQKLRDRYGVQLDYYKRALSQMTGRKVKKAIIYSLTLQEEIEVQ